MAEQMRSGPGKASGRFIKPRTPASKPRPSSDFKSKKRAKQSAKEKLNKAGEDLLAAYSPNPVDPVERQRGILVNRAKAIVKSNVLQSRECPNKFIEYCFKDSETGTPMRQADMHREMQDAMASGEDQINLYPRDHGKTTQIEGHIIWQLGNNPNLRIKIVCASDSKAVERLFAVIQHIKLNDRVQSVFPRLKPAKLGDWTKHKIVVDRDYISRDASIEALGVLSTATGGRADKIYADDVVDRRNALELPKLRETIKVAWDSDWSNLLEPNGQTVYVATPWHTADLTYKILKNPSYKVLKRAVGSESDHYAPVWPEKWDRAALMRRRRKIGQVEYDRGFRLVALSGEWATVNPEWINYWKTPPDLGKLLVFSIFDVSSGVSKDFFANVVVGVDPYSFFVYVLEAWHSKLTFLSRAKAVEDQARRWRPHITGIEEESMKSLTQYLDETTLLNVMPLRPHLPKAIRLMGITPPMERGQVLFNPSLHPSVIADPEGQGDLVSQLTEFPLAANDDLVDAFVYGVQLAQTHGLPEDDGVNIDVSILGNESPGDLLDIPDIDPINIKAI